MTTYLGIRGPDGTCSILVKDGERIAPLPHIVLHSPDGFNWGYGGSGPDDTAHSLLHHAVGKYYAAHFYQDFKFEFVAGWPGPTAPHDNDTPYLQWTLDRGDIITWISAKQLARARTAKANDAQEAHP